MIKIYHWWGDLHSEITDDVDAVWAALIATDGTGGYVNGDLVHSAVKIEDGVTVDTYQINSNYNLSSIIASGIDGVTADPVSGKILTL